jgi:hypothetical protein
VVPGEQLEQVRQWVENDQRMRQELESISAINRELVRRKRPGSQKSSKKRYGRWKSIFTFVALPTGKACLGNQVQKMEWITTLEAKTLCIRLVRQLGHERWLLGNNAWCDLTKYWALKHGSVHACIHRPHRRDARGQLQALPNGLQAVTLILCIAFVLCSALARLRSKLFRRYRLSMLQVSCQLYRSLWNLELSIRAQTPCEPPRQVCDNKSAGLSLTR